MCTNETKQDYIFLEAFGDHGKALGRDEIIDSIRDISLRVFDAKYLMRGPRSLGDLFTRAERSGYIDRVTPLSWRITDIGLKSKTYKDENYIRAYLAREPV